MEKLNANRTVCDKIVYINEHDAIKQNTNGIPIFRLNSANKSKFAHRYIKSVRDHMKPML